MSRRYEIPTHLYASVGAYVGDTPADVGAARSAGCHAIGAAWGSLDAERVRRAGPDVLAAHPDDVLVCVRRIVRGATA